MKEKMADSMMDFVDRAVEILEEREAQKVHFGRLCRNMRKERQIYSYDSLLV